MYQRDWAAYVDLLNDLNAIIVAFLAIVCCCTCYSVTLLIIKTICSPTHMTQHFV